MWFLWVYNFALLLCPSLLVSFVRRLLCPIDYGLRARLRSDARFVAGLDVQVSSAGFVLRFFFLVTGDFCPVAARFVVVVLRLKVFLLRDGYDRVGTRAFEFVLAVLDRSVGGHFFLGCVLRLFFVGAVDLILHRVGVVLERLFLGSGAVPVVMLLRFVNVLLACVYRFVGGRSIEELVVRDMQVLVLGRLLFPWTVSGALDSWLSIHFVVIEVGFSLDRVGLVVRVFPGFVFQCVLLVRVVGRYRRLSRQVADRPLPAYGLCGID